MTKDNRKRLVEFMGGNTMYMDPRTRANANKILAYIRKETLERVRKKRRRPEFTIMKVHEGTGINPPQVSYTALVLVLLGKISIRGKVCCKNSGCIKTATLMKYIGDIPS